MKAAVIYENGDPGVLRYEDVPDPECPEGCVVVDAEGVERSADDVISHARQVANTTAATSSLPSAC